MAPFRSRCKVYLLPWISRVRPLLLRHGFIFRVRRVDQQRHGSDAEMPLADIAAETAFVGAESVAVARQPVCLIVEHVVALRAVGHTAAVADDVTLSPRPAPTANKARHPTAWAFLFFSEFSVIRHIHGSRSNALIIRRLLDFRCCFGRFWIQTGAFCIQLRKGRGPSLSNFAFHPCAYGLELSELSGSLELVACVFR